MQLSIKLNYKIYSYNIDIFDKHYIVKVYFNSSNPIFTFQDHIENTSDLTRFTRIINKNNKYKYIDGLLVSKEINK